MKSSTNSLFLQPYQPAPVLRKVAPSPVRQVQDIKLAALTAVDQARRVYENTRSPHALKKYEAALEMYAAYLA